MAKIQSFKTAVFQIHNPSKRKTAILKKMLVHSHTAYTHILQKYLPTEDLVNKWLSWEKKKRQDHIRDLGNIIDKYIRKRFPYLAGCVKFGIKEDTIAQIKSYVELFEDQSSKSRTGKPGIPTVQSILTTHSNL